MWATARSFLRLRGHQPLLTIWFHFGLTRFIQFRIFYNDCAIPIKASGLQSRKQLTMTPFLIGVCGGTASGKTTVCEKIIRELGQANVPCNERKVVCLAQDSFYRQLNAEENQEANLGKFNFDSPDAFDFKLMTDTLHGILRGETVFVPVYNFTTNSRIEGEFVTIYPADVVLFEGILTFHFKPILDAFDMKVFVDTESDVRLSRRIMRDVVHRGRSFEHVIHQYVTTVKPAYDEFCQPTKKHADIILPGGGNNKWGIRLIVQHIQEILLARYGRKFTITRYNDDDERDQYEDQDGDEYAQSYTNGNGDFARFTTTPHGIR